ncbi:MAG: hypothetical protein ACJ757_02750 [Gaiellaceae bacterium]
MVAQVVDAVGAALGGECVDPVFELAAGERARYATSAAAGQDRVLEQRARNRAVPEVVTEGHVFFEWAGAFTGTDRDLAWQRGVAGSLMHDEEGAVLGRAASRSGRTIADDCARIERGDDREQTTGNELVLWCVEVGRE